MAHAGHAQGRNGRGSKRIHGLPRSGGRSSFPWINSQIIQASEGGDIHHLLGTIETHLMEMNVVNLSTALHRLAKMTANDRQCHAMVRQSSCLSDLLYTIAEAFCSGGKEAQPQSLSNVAWSLATLRVADEALIGRVADLAVTTISVFKPFELVTMLWAFAKLETLDSNFKVENSLKPLFHVSADHIIKNAQTFAFRCLATTAWAFATAKQHHGRLFRTIAAQMLPMVRAANCQEMANTAWAFGTANFHDDVLFSSLAQRAKSRLSEFKPQELSNILWGFASNGFFDEAFYAQATKVAQGLDLQAQHRANIVWAFARVQPRHALTKTTIIALLPWCTRQLGTFKPQEVSATVLAVAKAFGSKGESGDEECVSAMPDEVLLFFEAVAPWTVPRARDFSPQSLANTVSAFGMVSCSKSVTVVEALGDEVLKRCNALDAPMLLHLLQGFSAFRADASVKIQAVLQVLTATVADRLTDFRPQELQALSRFCAVRLGSRQRRDFTTEELRVALHEAAGIHTGGDAREYWPPVGLLKPGLPLHSSRPPDGNHHAELVDCLPDEAFMDQARIDGGDGRNSGRKVRNLRLNHSQKEWKPEVAQQSAKDRDRRCKRDPPTRITNQHSPLDAIDEGHMPLGQGTPQTPLCRMNEAGLMIWIPNAQVPMDMYGAASLETAMPTDCADRAQVAPAVFLRPRLPSGAPGHVDFQWICSIKNSFLHVQSNDDSDGPDSLECGSSQRSSSVPSRMDRADHDFEESSENWQKRSDQDSEVEQQESEEALPKRTSHPDLLQLDFEWGRRNPPAAAAAAAAPRGRAQAARFTNAMKAGQRPRGTADLRK